MSLVLLTKSPEAGLFSLEGFKHELKRLVNRKRGPDAVLDSLVSGLSSIGYDFLLNPRVSAIGSDDIVWVNGSINALRWAIVAKKAGKIRKLFVGPVIVVSPEEEDWILLDENINKIIFPSQWTRDYYSSIDSRFSERIEICPAGVEIPAESHDWRISSEVIVLLKSKEAELMLDDIIEHLKGVGLAVEVFRYGGFRQNSFFDKLNACRFLVYLSASESQGLALQEAWARNVPTFVWNRGYFEYKGRRWHSDKVSAPLLSEESGRFFRDIDSFKAGAREFIDNSGFEPRSYAERELSNEILARKFVSIINRDE